MEPCGSVSTSLKAIHHGFKELQSWGRKCSTETDGKPQICFPKKYNEYVILRVCVCSQDAKRCPYE